MGGVVLKRWVRRPSGASSTASIGLFEMTAQVAGTVARIASVPLRSGWSKQGKRRCASNGSKFE